MEVRDVSRTSEAYLSLPPVGAPICLSVVPAISFLVGVFRRFFFFLLFLGAQPNCKFSKTIHFKPKKENSVSRDGALARVRALGPTSLGSGASSRAR